MDDKKEIKKVGLARASESVPTRSTDSGVSATSSGGDKKKSTKS